MLKLEMKLDESKIQAEGKYTVESIHQAIEKAFSKYQFREEVQPDGTMTFYGNGQAKDYGVFGRLITTLKDKDWFISYAIKWLWYNSDDGIDENDYTVEDVLYHYIKKESAA